MLQILFDIFISVISSLHIEHEYLLLIGIIDFINFLLLFFSSLISIINVSVFGLYFLNIFSILLFLSSSVKNISSKNKDSYASISSFKKDKNNSVIISLFLLFILYKYIFFLFCKCSPSIFSFSFFFFFLFFIIFLIS